MAEISIMQLLKIAWKHIWAIILIAAIFGGMAFAYAKYVIVPTYASTTTIIFTNGGIVEDSTSGTVDQNKIVNGSDITASNYLGETVVEILKTPNIYKELAREFDNEYSYEQLSNAFKIARKSDGNLLIDITYTSIYGPQSMKIVNKFAEIACDYVPELIPYAKVKVVARALKYQKVSIGIAKFTAIFAVVGAALAYAVFFLIFILDQSIRGEDDYNAKYSIPLLGVVPDFNVEKTASYKYGKAYKGGYYDAQKY